MSAALWLGHERVSEVFAALSTDENDRTDAPEVRRNDVPVVVAKVGKRDNDVTIASIATARARRFVTLYPEVSGEIVYSAAYAGMRVAPGETLFRLDSRTAELALELAKVRVSEAQLALARAEQLVERNVSSKANVQDARIVLERAKFVRQQAEDALTKRTVRAPFHGIVGIPKVEVGDRVSPTIALVTVDDRSELLVEIDVPEDHLSLVKPNQKVLARTPSFPERVFEGTVDKIDSRVDPASRTVKVRAAVPNPQDLLRPGMSFAVELMIPGKPYPSVPELALQWSKGQSFVWRVKDGKADKVQVRSVRRLNRVILVDGDLKEGDLVVVEGVQRLRPGRSVDFSLPDPPPRQLGGRGP